MTNIFPKRKIYFSDLPGLAYLFPQQPIMSFISVTTLLHLSSLCLFILMLALVTGKEKDKVLPISLGLDAMFDLELTLRGYVFLEI